VKLGDALNGYRAEGKVGTFGAIITPIAYNMAIEETSIGVTWSTGTGTLIAEQINHC
jgi:hypothetical protein